MVHKPKTSATVAASSAIVVDTEIDEEAFDDFDL